MTVGTPFHRLRISATVVLLPLVAPIAAQAQATREELVNAGIEAYLNLEEAQARDYFVHALRPLQPPDSIWGVGVQYLTQMHLEAGNAVLA